MESIDTSTKPNQHSFAQSDIDKLISQLTTHEPAERLSVTDAIMLLNTCYQKRIQDKNTYIEDLLDDIS